MLMSLPSGPLRLGVLTSGGDCSGLNTCVRAITLHAKKTYNATVFGILGGMTGLVRRPLQVKELDIDGDSLYEMERDARLGGSRLKAFSTYNCVSTEAIGKMPQDVLEDALYEGYKSLNLDALLCIGGDGSLSIIASILKTRIPFVAIPKTIDHDVGATEASIGHASAVQMAVEALDVLVSTAHAHNRIFILEVMGRDAGHIALRSGIAGGADAILLPECTHNWLSFFMHLKEVHSRKGYALVVVSESVSAENGEKKALETTQKNQPLYGGIAAHLGRLIQEETAIETRAVSLGHLQRGGGPVAYDRLIANSFGVHAVDLVHQNQFRRLVVWKNQRAEDVSIDEALGLSGRVRASDPLLYVAKSLGIYVGE